MSKIKVELDTPVVNGKQVSFFSPIGSKEADSIIIHEVDYALVDSHGKALAKLDYSWTAGALVSVILDTTTNKAYVQNATSNAYIEDNFVKKRDIIPIEKGGTNASDVSAARTNLNFGYRNSYTGTENNQTIDTGQRGSNLLLIVGRSYVGWLTPMGGMMIEHGTETLGAKVTTYGGGETDARHIARYEDGYIQLKTDSKYINGKNYVYDYICM